MERKCKWGSLGVGQMWVFWVVGGLGRVGVGGFEGVHQNPLRNCPIELSSG